MAATAPAPAATNWAAVIEGHLLVGLGALLATKIWYGQLPLYIHPRYTPLVLVTATLILLIGGIRLWQIADPPQQVRGRGATHALLLAPLVLGVLLPIKPAGSSLIDPSQLNRLGRTYQPASATPVGDTAGWTLLDWMYARYTMKAEQIGGTPVDVVGFVYRTPETPPGEFFVVRYTLACCVADRSGVSLLVRWPGAETLQNDHWVRVRGAVEAQPNEAVLELAVADARVEPVPQPDEPYLYP
jgi:putative membrane protein